MPKRHTLMDRRRFLKAGLDGFTLLAIGGCSIGFALETPKATKSGRSSAVLFSAARSKSDEFFLIGMKPDGTVLYQRPLPARFHGGCATPAGHLAVFFARRPGAVFYVLQTDSGNLLHEVKAAKDRHFYGHGTFDAAGRLLYATENDFARGRGVIGVYDAHQRFKRVGEFDAGGIGPHEIKLHPDGKTLVVAVGGIDTRPDSGRVKLNLDAMESSLALIDRQSGQVLQQYPSPHRQLSCRHLDISTKGVVIAGFQYEGPEWDDQPLLARLDSVSRRWNVIELPLEQQRALRQYIASVAINSDSGTAMITAPRGNQVALLSVEFGQLLSLRNVEDAAGVVAWGNGFIVSNGGGEIRTTDGEGLNAFPMTKNADFQWDNHMLIARV